MLRNLFPNCLIFASPHLSGQIDIGAQILGAPLYKIHSERWTEDLFGEGPQLGHDHVMVCNTDANLFEFN